MLDKKVVFPLTIEKQLEKYYLDEKHTERHEVLWHTWNQNKRWITQVLEITLCSYPTYSKHDESHAQSVLHNIEMILGEERIAELSASDCFVLLHTVYIHDIGMCITHQDRKEILTNRAFVDMICEMEEQEEGSVYIHRALEALRKTDYSYDDEEDKIRQQQRLFLDKLEVYYGIIQLIGDFRRSEHGEKSRERLYNWTKESDKLGSGFSLAGMPQRIFLTIANCARIHTHPDFSAIMELPQEDDGYVSDYIHPRFISVLLQLGDILDMDNNRFNPLMQMVMGNIPESSQLHYEKHMSIRKLHIRPDKIEIEADCENQEALRLIRKECDMLRSILKDAGYSWAVICPAGYRGSLPTLDSVNLYLKGQKIPGELVTTQFKISQKKAFSLLQGANVYSGTYVFLREFLQNAVDATKIQYWNDCVSTSGCYKNRGNIQKESPYQLEQYMSTDNYPIEIEMEIQKKLPDGTIKDLTVEDIEKLDKGKGTDSIYGVKIRVKDFGTGIDKDSILNISKVGSSRKKEREIIESMPEWLRPTAEFGIGLQSVFLLVGSFWCHTRTRSGEKYEITFGSGSSARYEGYINVKPLESSSLKDNTFGTCFEVFIPYDKKRLHQNCFAAWNGEDPFSETYERRRAIRHAAELMTQMALYLDGLVGELLFPVHLSIKRSPFIDIPINTTSENKIENIYFEWMDEENKERHVKETRPWIQYKKSWIYYKKQIESDSSLLYGEIDNDIFLLDCKSARLHLWSGEINTFIAISAKNLIRREENVEAYSDGSEFGVTKIYYKGIELQNNVIGENNDFIEYIDIKGGLDRELLNLSRKGFTEEGEKYFESYINIRIKESVQKVLKYLGAKQVTEDGDSFSWAVLMIGKQIKEKISSIVSGDKDELTSLCEQIISAAVLAYLSKRDEYNELTAFGVDRDKRKNGWEELIKEIIKVLSEDDEEIRKVSDALRDISQFFNIVVYDEKLVRPSSRSAINFAEFFNENESFAILQKRENRKSVWYSYLIKIENNCGCCAKIRELIFAKDKELKKELSEQIDTWGESIIRVARGKESDEKDYRQQFLMNWIIRNVPTIGMLSDDTGDIRINILGSQIYPFVYLNNNFKWLILQRMGEEYKKKRIERFSTLAWQGRQFMSCNNIPFSAYFVKRGMFAKESCHKVIMPISGNWIFRLNQRIKDVQELQSLKDMELLVGEVDIRNYLQTIVAQNKRGGEVLREHQNTIFKLKRKMDQGNILQNVYEFYTDLISEGIELENEKREVNAQFLEEKVKDINAWHKLYLEIAEIYLSLSEKDSSFILNRAEGIRQKKEFKDICYFMDSLRKEDWKIFLRNEVQEKFEIKEISDPNRECVIDFIRENSIYPMLRENIEISYDEFIDEILQLFEDAVYKKLELKIQEKIRILDKEK